MRKPIAYVNMALLAVTVWLAAEIGVTWRRNHARYAQFAVSPAVSRRPGAYAVGADAEPAGPARSSELITYNLFSPDRNNAQPLVEVEKDPPPPVPIVVGTVNLGSGMVALMADQKQARSGAFRRLKAGDEIAGYRVVKIAEQQVVVEFEGEKTTIDVYESAQNVRRAAGAGSTTSKRPAAPQVLTAVPAGKAVASKPATATPATSPPSSRTARPAGSPTADPFLTVTIEGNRKKYSRLTPFGVQTWYVDLPPTPELQGGRR